MKDVIIVGGGLTGMLTARALHQAGLNVLLIEQHELGRDSSWANNGMLAPLYPWRFPAPVTELMLEGLRHYPILCAELLQQTDVDVQWSQSGTLLLDTKEREVAEKWANRYQQEYHWLTGSALHDCEPKLASSFEQGLFFPQFQQLRNPRQLTALRASLRLVPLLISEHNPVEHLLVSDGHIQGVHLNGMDWRAKHVIMTTGAWTQQFPELQTPTLKLRTVATQTVIFRGEPNIMQRMLIHDGSYIVPRRDGRILFGIASTQPEHAQTPSPERLTEMREQALQWVPDLAAMKMQHHWCGLFPEALDGVPYIGEHPHIGGLWVNVGLGQYGFAAGLGAVRLLVTQILGQSSDLNATTFSLNR